VTVSTFDLRGSPYDKTFCDNLRKEFSFPGRAQFSFTLARLVMKKLPAVEEARAIMKEGMEWGVWKWLTEKKRVRAIADKARAALDDQEMQVKLAWPDV
jgi:hypothetical protein